MNWNLIAKLIRDRWKGLSTYCAGIFIYGVFMTAIYPALSGIKGLTDYTKAMPDVVMKMFGSTGTIDFMNFNNYVGLEFLSLMVIVIAAPFVIGFANQAVCGELHEGTLELLMSQPIKRWEMLTSKIAVLVGGIAVIALSTSLSVIIPAPIAGIDIHYTGFICLIPILMAILIAIGGYSLFFSNLLKYPRQVIMASAGLTFAFYLFNFVGLSVKSVNWLKYLSIFHYYNVEQTLDAGTVPVANILILLGAAALFTAAAFALFRKKDIAP